MIVSVDSDDVERIGDETLTGLTTAAPLVTRHGTVTFDPVDLIMFCGRSAINKEPKATGNRKATNSDDGVIVRCRLFPAWKLEKTLELRLETSDMQGSQ